LIHVTNKYFYSLLDDKTNVNNRVYESIVEEKESEIELINNEHEMQKAELITKYKNNLKKHLDKLNKENIIDKTKDDYFTVLKEKLKLSLSTKNTSNSVNYGTFNPNSKNNNNKLEINSTLITNYSTANDTADTNRLRKTIGVSRKNAPTLK
jgi:hypothetical protein